MNRRIRRVSHILAELQKGKEFDELIDLYNLTKTEIQQVLKAQRIERIKSDNAQGQLPLEDGV